MQWLTLVVQYCVKGNYDLGDYSEQLTSKQPTFTTNQQTLKELKMSTITPVFEALFQKTHICRHLIEAMGSSLYWPLRKRSAMRLSMCQQISRLVITESVFQPRKIHPVFSFQGRTVKLLGKIHIKVSKTNLSPSQFLLHFTACCYKFWVNLYIFYILHQAPSILLASSSSSPKLCERPVVPKRLLFSTQIQEVQNSLCSRTKSCTS